MLILLLLFFAPLSFSQEISNDQCLDCHGDKDLTTVKQDTIEISLFIDNQKFSHSVHGDFSCIDCHENITELPHEENLPHPDCNQCHDDVAEEYLQSYHGQALIKGIKDAPYCWDCHSSHYIFSRDDTLSTIHPMNLPVTCARCHSDPRLVKKYNIPIPDPTAAYKHSIHFKMISEDHVYTAATCTDCHGAHTLQPANNPGSKINRFNIPQTCSACHDSIYHVYIESVHGRGLLKGASDAPVCTDCHSEHNIKEHTDPNSTVFSAAISKTLCPQCHEAERIVSKYQMNPGVVNSYQDSYHGLANRGGSVVAANCASCHGVHDIRPSSDPKSSINKKNLVKTCGKCHPGISAQVMKGTVHIRPTPQADKLIYYVTIFYYSMIFVVIGGMLFHNGLDFKKKFIARIKGKHEPHVEMLSGREIERLNVNERIQHFLLMGSFTMLVYTGFAMKFPEAWWAAPFVRWEGAFAFRGLLHRIAAVVMLSLAFYHVFYLVTTRRGKEQFKALMPKLKDIYDVIDMFKYYLGMSKDKPKFERYNYIEKAEYLALIWGTIIMGVTGLILWFENLAMKFFPKWITDVCTVIHYYEAVLASLAILVWHFYFQFFDPHVYPMNTTCITGKMSEEDFKEEHPLEYEKMTQQHR